MQYLASVIDIGGITQFVVSQQTIPRLLLESSKKYVRKKEGRGVCQKRTYIRTRLYSCVFLPDMVINLFNLFINLLSATNINLEVKEKNIPQN